MSLLGLFYFKLFMFHFFYDDIQVFSEPLLTFIKPLFCRNSNNNNNNSIVTHWNRQNLKKILWCQFLPSTNAQHTASEV